MLLDHSPRFFADIDKRVDHAWIKQFSPANLDYASGCFHGQCGAVRAIRGHGVETIRNGEDTPAKGNAFPTEAAGISASVVALVMSKDDFGGIREKGYRFDQVVSQLDMTLHYLTLFIRQCPGLKEDVVGYGQFSNVVQPCSHS